MINVTAYPFLDFSDLTCHLEDTGIGVFWSHCAICKETKFGSSDQEASPPAGKNTEIILTPCCAWKCVPKAISGGVKIVLSLLLMCGAVFYFFLEIAWNDLLRNTNQNFLDCKIIEFKKNIFQTYLVKYSNSK